MKYGQVEGEFRDVETLTADKRVTCRLGYRQFSRVREPHFLGELAHLYVNDTLVDKIVFTEDPQEPKEKTLRVDITELLVSGVNSIRIRAQIDRDFANKGFHSEVDFRLTADGERPVDDHYEARLPFRVVEDTWLLPRK